MKNIYHNIKSTYKTGPNPQKNKASISSWHSLCGERAASRLERGISACPGHCESVACGRSLAPPVTPMNASYLTSTIMFGDWISHYAVSSLSFD